MLDSGLRYVDKFGGLHGMMKSIRANEPGKLNKSRVLSPGGCNDIKSLSGIETPPVKIISAFSGAVATTLNPYQGLKRNNLRLIVLLHLVATTLNPYQGLKHCLSVALESNVRVATTLNPYQGLKPKITEHQAEIHPGCNDIKSLSGIETVFFPLSPPLLFSRCNDIKSLSGIETLSQLLKLLRLHRCNDIKSLSGIETRFGESIDTKKGAELQRH